MVAIGGLLLQQAREDCPEAIRDAIFDGRDIVSWQRSNAFQQVALKRIVADVLVTCGCDLPRADLRVARRTFSEHAAAAALAAAATAAAPSATSGSARLGEGGGDCWTSVMGHPVASATLSAGSSSGAASRRTSGMWRSCVLSEGGASGSRLGGGSSGRGGIPGISKD